VDCVFCAIVAGEAPSRQVASGEHWTAFLDISPVTTGHTLVVPRRHAGDLWAMSAEQAQQLMGGVHEVAHLLRERLAPAGMNLLQSNGVAAWQTVFHVHVHVIPRYEGDGLRPPSPLGPAAPEDLAAVHERLTAG
jgi:histidine triad (HIT) family protein